MVGSHWPVYASIQTLRRGFLCFVGSCYHIHSVHHYVYYWADFKYDAKTANTK